VSEWKGDRAAIESAVTAASQMLAEIEQVPPPTPEGTLPMHTPLARARARLNRARDKLDRHDQWGKDLGAQLVKHRATVARLDEQIHSLKREIEEDPLE
jgi:hypothetical protein